MATSHTKYVMKVIDTQQTLEERHTCEVFVFTAVHCLQADIDVFVETSSLEMETLRTADHKLCASAKTTQENHTHNGCAQCLSP